ncbi:MAG: sulfatase-like hydrolase/transferase, partial [Verrucomicrobiales bacterium]
GPAARQRLRPLPPIDVRWERVLEALEEGPNRDNTIVVLWSDHGWHLGEKQHWQKYTMWRAATRVPLIIRVPEGVPGLPEGTAPGGVCSRPVNLLSLYPTLTELCGLPPKGDNSAPSLRTLLQDPQRDWPHVSVTFSARAGTYSVSADRWRYIRYADGGEELYDISEDPYEWHNLAGRAEHAATLDGLRARGPQKFAELVKIEEESLPLLTWQPGNGPASKPDGSQFGVVFLNRRESPVELFWVDRQGKPKSYGIIGAGKKGRQQTRPGAVWQVAEGEGGAVLGHFVVDDRTARAVIPKP